MFVQDVPCDTACANLTRIDANEDACYVLYTSGSTGRPKGALLPRRGMINLYESAKRFIKYDKNDICVSVTTVSFDIFICDTVMPLFFGCTVALSNEEELRQPALLAKLIDAVGAGFIQTTPTRMRSMMQNKEFLKAAAKHINKMILAGEMIPLSLLKLIQRKTKAMIINGYGPTEATVYSNFKDLTHMSHVTIGTPITNTRMYILDRKKHPVPIGVLGEAYISGAGVSLGYIKREELNKKAFSPDPYWPGHIMYKTGDICAFLPDGDIVMCGRIDHQVKLRGQRIELGEIEATLRAVNGIEEAVVKDWGEGTDKYLCAYYQTSQDVDENVIRDLLKKKLPAYMIPSFFIGLKQLPLTLSGKVNKTALTEPDRKRIHGKGVTQNLKMSATEKMMANVWQKVLKAENIGPDDSFCTGRGFAQRDQGAGCAHAIWMENTDSGFLRLTDAARNMRLHR